MSWRRAATGVVLAGLATLAGYYGFVSGSILAQRDLARMNGRVEDLSQTIAQLERYNLALAEAADQAKLAEARWRERYETLAADQRFVRLFDRAKSASADGVDGGRLAAVADAAPGGGRCEEIPAAKSFKVSTPISENGADSAGFADNRIVVTANGISAINRSGTPLAWFDPKQPIAIRFSTLDGTTSVASGILPISHTIQISGAEYRFEVDKGPRGFVRIGGTECRFGP